MNDSIYDYDINEFRECQMAVILPSKNVSKFINFFGAKTGFDIDKNVFYHVFLKSVDKENKELVKVIKNEDGDASDEYFTEMLLTICFDNSLIDCFWKKTLSDSALIVKNNYKKLSTIIKECDVRYLLATAILNNECEECIELNRSLLDYEPFNKKQLKKIFRYRFKNPKNVSLEEIVSREAIMKEKIDLDF